MFPRHPSRTLRIRAAGFLALASLSTLAGCKSRSFGNAGSKPNDETVGQDPDYFTISENEDTFPELKSKFYEEPMIFVNLEKWDGNRMSHTSFDKEQTHFGAVVSVLKTNPGSGSHCPTSEIKEGDLLFRTNQFSIKTTGNTTRNTLKPNLKFSWENKKQRFLGMRSLTLKSMWKDASQTREYFAWRLFAKAGVPAGRHTYAKLCINGRYFGLYSLLEDVDKPYLTDRFGKKGDDGNLYKANWQDLEAATLAYRKPQDGKSPGASYYVSEDVKARTYELRTNEDKDDPVEFQTYDDLATFIRRINGIDIPGQGPSKFNTPEYKKSVEEVFDVKAFLKWLAVNSLMSSWDNYWDTPGNFFLYNKGAEKDFMAKPYFVWLPWDYDNSFGVSYKGENWAQADIVKMGEPDKTVLTHSILANEDYMKFYLDFMEHFLDKHFDHEKFMREIEDDAGLWKRIEKAAHLESDHADSRPHTGRRFTNNQVLMNARGNQSVFLDGTHFPPIVDFTRQRVENVRQQLTELRKKFPKGSSGETFQ